MSMLPRFVINLETCPSTEMLYWLVENCGLDHWHGKTGYLTNVKIMYAEIYINDDDAAVMFKLMFPESKTIGEMGEYSLKPVYFFDDKKFKRMPECIDLWPMATQP